MKFKVIKFKKIKSTNDEAINLIKKKKISPTIIITENQTKGRGTMGKTWISMRGNLFISMLFQLKKKEIDFKYFAYLTPLIIKKILEKYSKYEIQVKWPNDLLIKRRKLCGILQETIEYKSRKFLVIGIGINTFFSPKNKKFSSISLFNCNKKNFNNYIIFKKIKKFYENIVSDLEKNDKRSIENNLKLLK